MNVEKYLSMIPKSVAVKRVQTPIFKVPAIIPPKKKRKVEQEPEFLDEEQDFFKEQLDDLQEDTLDDLKEEPTEEFHQEQPILIEFIDYKQTVKTPVVPFKDVNQLDKRSRILEKHIDLLTRSTAKLVVQAERKERKLMKLLKLLNVNFESNEDIIQSVDVDLPISTVDGLNDLNKRLMDDRLFYQRFVRILSFFLKQFLNYFFYSLNTSTFTGQKDQIY